MKPLEGVLVIAIEQAVAAPFCTARLAEAGARVIKIERPGGDFARNYDSAAKGDSTYFAWINQGKESVELDFKQEEDRELLAALLENADVLVQNLSAGALARAGFDPAELRKVDPRLITCDISGYGDTPELENMKAYDLLVQAESGLVSISGGPNEIGRIGVSICDIGAGMAAHAAIVEALLARQKSGEGASLSISLFDVAADWMNVPLMHNDFGKGPPKRVGLQHPSIAPYGAYKTKEGLDTLISIQNEREWSRLCTMVLGKPELATNPLFTSNNDRVANLERLNEAISESTKTITANEFREKLKEADIAYGAVNSVEDLSSHKALRRRTITNSTGKPVAIAAPPLRIDQSDQSSPGKIPAIGEHTKAVRREFLPD